MGRLIVNTLFMLAFITSCSAAHLFPIPLRDADLYPQSQSKGGIAIAVDRLNTSRIKQYFGADLMKAEMLPINIVVSNHGQGRYMIRPSDVLLMQGRDVLDPLPVTTVEAAVRSEYGRMSVETAKKITAYFQEVMLREKIVTPQENYQGIVFLKPEIEKPEWGVRNQNPFSIAQLFRDGDLKVHIAVTDLETKERIHFGPFSLTAP